MDFKKLFKNYIFPISTISGSIIGVGFFSLPYIASKVGIWIMLFYFVLLTTIVLFIHLIFGEISLKTPDYKRFPGFMDYYFGKWAKAYSLYAGSIIYLVVLLVYLIVGGQFLHSALSPFFGGSELSYTFIYFTAGAIIVYFGITAVSKVEFLALIFLFVSFFLAFFKGLPEFSLLKIFNAGNGFDIGNIFLPYGAIIFSLWGIGLIPEAEEMLGHDKKNLKKIIFAATLIPAIFYFLFVLMIVGITGQNIKESALVGLNNFLGDGVVLISLLMGAVITFSAFITHSLNLKKVLIFDLKIKEKHAFVITCLVPMILFLSGLRSFIPIISFVGGIFLGIDGIMILLMYKKIGGKKWLIYPLSLVFLLGIVYEIVYFIK